MARTGGHALVPEAPQASPRIEDDARLTRDHFDAARVASGRHPLHRDRAANS